MPQAVSSFPADNLVPFRGERGYHFSTSSYLTLSLFSWNNDVAGNSFTFFGQRRVTSVEWATHSSIWSFGHLVWRNVFLNLCINLSRLYMFDIRVAVASCFCFILFSTHCSNKNRESRSWCIKSPRAANVFHNSACQVPSHTFACEVCSHFTRFCIA